MRAAGMALWQRKALWRSVTLWVWAVATPYAAAQGSPFFQSNEASITAGAVVAVSRDAGSAWYNPAGLGANDRTQIDLTATAFTLRIRNIDDGFITALPNGEERRQHLNATSFGLVSPAVVIARRLRPGLSLALGAFTVQQDNFSLRNGVNEVINGARYVTRLDLDSAETQYHIGPSIGWQPHPRWRVGMSIFGVYELQVEHITLAVGTINEADQSGALLLGEARNDTQTFGFEALVGVQWQPIDALHLGFTLRAPRLLVKEWARSTVTNAAGLVSNGPGEEDNLGLGVSSQPEGAGAGWLTPVRAVLGAAWQFAQGWLSAEAEIGSSWNNGANSYTRSWNLRAGTLIDLNPRVAVGGGLFTLRDDSSSQAQVDYYGFTLGGRLRSPINLARGERARQLVFTTVLALRYALGLGTLNGFRYDLTQGIGNRDQPLIAEAQNAGQRFHEISLHFGSGVRF